VRCFQIDRGDNVVTLLDHAEPDTAAAIVGEQAGDTMIIREVVAAGHKAALADIAAESPVIKYGVVIGIASAFIPAGRWVHLHNCRSQVDKRSSGLDLHSGLARDTSYA
jgi:hypothetical protein